MQRRVAVKSLHVRVSSLSDKKGRHVAVVELPSGKVQSRGAIRRACIHVSSSLQEHQAGADFAMQGGEHESSAAIPVPKAQLFAILNFRQKFAELF